MSSGALGTADVPAAAADELPPEGAAKKIEGRSPWRLAFERLRSDRASMIALGFIVLLIAVALLAPVLSSIIGHGPIQEFRTTGLSPDGSPQAPSGTFLLGTDPQGRDVLVRIIYGARISLLVGVVATAAEVVIGVTLGLAAGFLGGVVDAIVGFILELVLSIPYLLFAISLVSIARPSLTITIIVISVFGWSAIARTVRGQVLTIREREYIEAARSLGAGSLRIMVVDILPNVVAQVIVYASLLIPVSIITEAALSFLGVGVPPPTAEWGQMLADSEGWYQVAWWYLVFPSLALLVMTLSFNIFGDGVRDALDPRTEQLFK